MPEITVLGWFHTAAGFLALICGFTELLRHRVISMATTTGRLYLGLTGFAALSALAIFNQGGFNIAHWLAVLTLLALVAGAIIERTGLGGTWSGSVQAVCYTATVLFHMIPAITDALRRLPVDDPVVTDIRDPLLQGFYLAFLLGYMIVLGLQVRWLRKSAD